MAITVFPLNNIDYDAHDVETYMSTRGSGIFAGNDFDLGTITSSDTPTINILAGEGWIAPARFIGKKITMEAPQNVILDTAPATQNRKDVIALRFTSSTNKAELVAIKGKESAQPQLPTRQTNKNIYELFLYAVLRKPASVVTKQDIEDLRANKSYCGYMADAVTRVDNTLKKDGWLADAGAVGKRVIALENENKKIKPTKLGGTGNDFSNIPQNAIIRKSNLADDTGLYYTETRKGAFYAEDKDQMPVFGTLPLNVGGTGSANNLKDAPANAVVLKSVELDSLKHVQSKQGAFYSNGVDQMPRFGTLPTSAGGTGNDLSNAQANALVKMSAEGKYCIAVPTHKGAVHINTDGGGLSFGVLPTDVGGTGVTTVEGLKGKLGIRRDILDASPYNTAFFKDHSSSVIFYEGLGLVFFRGYVKRISTKNFEVGDKINIFGVPAPAKPNHTTALAVHSTVDLVGRVDSQGLVELTFKEKVISKLEYNIYVAGVWVV